MKNLHSPCGQSSCTRGDIKRLLRGSVSSLLITSVQFALYWLVLEAMMSNIDCRIEDDEHFIFDEVLSLLYGYACSSDLPSESVMFGDFLTPQEV